MGSVADKWFCLHPGLGKYEQEMAGEPAVYKFMNQLTGKESSWKKKETPLLKRLFPYSPFCEFICNCGYVNSLYCRIQYVPFLRN